ncbi:MAG: cyclic nucleotide-binding domain-containing protein [Gemmatimonadota bacterium]|jgi:signal transduction histidine kinase
MAGAELVERLAAFPTLSALPREELEWLVEHGELVVFGAGELAFRKGEPIDRMFIVLSGHIAVHRDWGTGPRRVMDWYPGDITGTLPYSRASVSTVDIRLDEETETLVLHKECIPEMIQRCTAFTTHVVHLMLDRARSFKASNLQEERAVSLGKLAAGLAHELNNPASANVRAARLLVAGLPEADEAVRGLGRASLTDDHVDAIERLREACLDGPAHPPRSPMEQSDHEDRIAEWLERRGSDPALAASLADTALGIDALDEAATRVPPEALDAALRWTAARCAIHSLASDVGDAATRIYELVDAVKRFTHMDNLSASEIVDVEESLRDTLTVMSSRIRSKDAQVRLDIEEDLPRVRAAGGDLNQVWLNLVDNALDARPVGSTSAPAGSWTGSWFASSTTEPGSRTTCCRGSSIRSSRRSRRGRVRAWASRSRVGSCAAGRVT